MYVVSDEWLEQIGRYDPVSQPRAAVATYVMWSVNE